ncbi:hypothetical protein KI387_020336 [Taxus chinensis]|uniref:GBF-interacting protein 1 N-terminal domain-containing protein n=1 Tax=Taxus chinensis TaxID=29808 RepID=A0AA38G8Q0_TAXCH|nr:hypothetical protein KI387_020336 [Taxus chinensis]
MDPNETAQKLLYQDPFHEVKRKRDKRKENVSNRDSVDLRARPGSVGRGGRGGRGNYPPRYTSYDAGDGRAFNMSRENGGYQSVNRVNSNYVNPSSATTQNAQIKQTVPGTSSLPTSTMGAPVIPNGNSSNVHTPHFQAQVGGWSAATGNSTMADVLKSNSAQQVQAQLQSAPAATSVMMQGQPVPGSQQYITSRITTSVSGVYSSSSDPVLVPSLDTRVSGAVGTIKREVGAQRPNVDQNTNSHENKSSMSNFSNSLQKEKTQPSILDAADSESKVSANENSATLHPFRHDRLVSKSPTVDVDHRLSEMQPQMSNSTSTASSAGRSSVTTNHYNVKPQQFVGPQKGGPNKEWKPKANNQNTIASPGIIGTSTVSTSTSEVSRSPSPASNCVTLDDEAAKLHKKLDEMNVRDDQHVIMPNHLQVPEIERTGLSFGSFDASFDANFGVNFGTSYCNDDESEKSSTPLSEESQGTEEAVEEPSSSINTASVTPHEDYSLHPQVSATTVDNMPSTNDVAVSINPAVALQSDPTKVEVVIQPGPQYSLVQTTPNYPSIGLVTPIMGSQYPSYEQHTEPQLRDASRFPSFVQPAYDPSTSFYTPIVRPSSDGDARFSPFLGSAPASKYNGNLTILSGQNGPSSQESGNNLVLSNAGPTALATQTAGIVQTTIPLPQQPVPVFRQPASVHIQHYPPNYIPYHQYISPVYVPSPTMHNFVGNGGFAQLPAGSSYPQAAAGSSYTPAAAGVKYSLSSQYKPGTASGNSPHIGVPAGYGSYTTAPSGYSASPAVTAGNVSGGDDIGGSHYKENNMYIAGQQGEGSAVWFPQQPRDLLGVQASSYYNMQQIPHGQHVTFAHTQGGHAAFSGLYHPTQSGPAPNAHPMLQQTQALGGAVGVVGAQAGVYQQPQRAQLSWPNTY